jgi:hypothetical protein
MAPDVGQELHRTGRFDQAGDLLQKLVFALAGRDGLLKSFSQSENGRTRAHR